MSKYFKGDIEALTKANKNFRKILFTGKHSQLSLMSLKPAQDIGDEVHKVDQFFRIEQGNGKAVIGGKANKVSDGDAFIVPAGTKHNVFNIGDTLLKLYTIYSPAQHPDGEVVKEKPITEEEAKDVLTSYLEKLDQHADVKEIIPLLSSTSFKLSFLKEPAVHGISAYKEWYAYVKKHYFKEKHKILSFSFDEKTGKAFVRVSWRAKQVVKGNETWVQLTAAEEILFTRSQYLNVTIQDYNVKSIQYEKGSDQLTEESNRSSNRDKDESIPFHFYGAPTGYESPGKEPYKFLIRKRDEELLSREKALTKRKILTTMVAQGNKEIEQLNKDKNRSENTVNKSYSNLWAILNEQVRKPK